MSNVIQATKIFGQIKRAKMLSKYGYSNYALQLNSMLNSYECSKLCKSTNDILSSSDKVSVKIILNELVKLGSITDKKRKEILKETLGIIYA